MYRVAYGMYGISTPVSYGIITQAQGIITPSTDLGTGMYYNFHFDDLMNNWVLKKNFHVEGT